MISDLRTEYRRNPSGIETLRPRFSWVRDPNHQYAYQLIVTEERDGAGDGKRLVWDSGNVICSESKAKVNGERTAGAQQGNHTFFDVLQPGNHEFVVLSPPSCPKETQNECFG